MIKLCALDTSTSSTGIANFHNGKYHSSTVLQTDKKIKGDDKLNQMIEFIYSYLSKEKPEIILTETVAVTRNVASTRMLQELTGAVRGYCVGKGIDYVSLRPSEWRAQVVRFYQSKPVGRKREDQKAWSLDIVNNKMNIKTTSDDEADAICLGIGYLNMFGE